MVYLPQYLDSQGDCYCVISAAGYSTWQIVNPGTGYQPGDVGATVSIPTPYSGQIPAQCKITAVTAGGISGLSEFVAGGNYSNGGLYSGQPMAITGGSGTGCTVQVASGYVPFYTEDVGFGSSFSQLTCYINVFDYVFIPSFWMEGYGGGLKLQFTSASSLYNYNEFLQVQLTDDRGIVIFDGSFIRPTQPTTVQVVQDAFWDVLLCLDTGTQTIHVFVNDEEWVLDYSPGYFPPDYIRRPRSLGWTPGNTGPISNPYGVIPGWKIQGVGGGFASLWMSPTYIDMTVATNRRIFTTGNNRAFNGTGSAGTWVDPATFPSAPVNLYLRKGDNPSDFKNNHGTAVTPWKGTSSNAPWMFFMSYWTSWFAKTHVNTPYTAHIPGGTVRPGAVVAPKPSGSYPGYGVSNGTITVSGEFYTFTPRPDFVGYGEVYFSLMENMPDGYVQPRFSGGSIGVGTPISIDAPTIPETRRRSLALHAPPYTGGFEEIDDFYMPIRFYDRPMVLVRSDETLDDNINPNFTDHLAVTFQEFGPDSCTYTNYGVEPADYPWPEVDYFDWGVWNNKIFSFQADPWGDDYAYYLLDYAPGATYDPPVYTFGSWSADIGFGTGQSGYWDCPFPLCWQGLTNAFIAVINPNANTPNAWDAFVISDQGHQVIRALFTLPGNPTERVWEPDPMALIPDPANNCNWLILFNNDVHTQAPPGGDQGWSMLYHQCFSSIDGHVISDGFYQFEAADVCSNFFYGLVGWGGNMYPLTASPEYFHVYCGEGWWGDQSDQRTRYPRGNTVVSIAKDCSHYVVDYMVPKDGDPSAFGELNAVNPSGYYVHDRDNVPYYMGWGFAPDYAFGPVLTIDHETVKLVTLYPFAEPTSEYGFSAHSDFDASFGQISISTWCCKHVHIESDVPRNGGFVTLPRLTGGGNQGAAFAVSADGHTAAGWVSPPSDDSFQIACYWVDNAGPHILTDPDPANGENAQAFGVSGDGSAIVGVTLEARVGGIPGNNLNLPFYWTAAGGFKPFGLVAGAANCISSDGGRIAGYVTHDNFTSIACYWGSNDFVRTELPQLPTHTNSAAYALSSNGTVIVGSSQIGFDGQTQRAWRWTQVTGTVDLGLPPGATWGGATGVSSDGATVVGFSDGGSFTWTAAGGMVVLPEPMQGISGDGLTLIGDGAPPKGSPHPLTGNVITYMKGGILTVPTPVPLDPAYPDTIQTTSTYGVNGNGLVISGATNPYAYPYYLPFLYYVPTSWVATVSLDCTPALISIVIRDSDGTVRFSGDWAVANPVDEYQVLFSIDTVAQHYALYINDVAPIGNPTWGPPGPIGG